MPKIPGNASDLPQIKPNTGDVIPIVIDGVIYQVTIKEALSIIQTILAIISGRLNG